MKHLKKFNESEDKVSIFDSEWAKFLPKQLTIINQNGEVEHKLTPFSPGALVGVVQGFQGITPFESFGNIPVWILACSIILIVLLFRYPHNYNNNSD